MRLLGLFLTGLLFGACRAPIPKPAAAEHASHLPDLVEVSITRTCSVTLHADVSFPVQARETIKAASSAWAALSEDRIRIDVDYDVDFESIGNLKTHVDAKHSTLLAVFSDFDIVQSFDAEFAPATPLAVTTTDLEGDVRRVWLIVDRIPVPRAREIVTHEFGHVCGMPDLPSFGSIMSGASFKGAPPIESFSAEDRALCRAYHYCQ